MNKPTQATLAVALMVALWTAGCASKPKEEASLTTAQVLQHGDVKGKPPSVFNKELEEVRQAGLRALTFVGCELKQQQPYYLRGWRPNKMGLFVGSGGETVEIFLYPESTNVTHVWVDTDLSFAGIAGQQNWDKKVLAEIQSLIQTPAKTQ